MPADPLISAHRGAPDNPANRFEKIHLEPDADWNPDDDGGRPQVPRTQFLVDHGKTTIACNDSPDIGLPKPIGLPLLPDRRNVAV